MNLLSIISLMLLHINSLTVEAILAISLHPSLFKNRCIADPHYATMGTHLIIAIMVHGCLLYLHVLFAYIGHQNIVRIYNAETCRS
jgi:hypothetical protein